MSARHAMELIPDAAGCLDADTLAAYVGGRLADGELGRADRHIDVCGSCRGELSALAVLRTQPEPAGDDVDAGIDRLGRYHVLRELGRGAMGLVLRAWDPELARPVALKLLHRVSAETRDRLRREAQAMARLRHPNVVTVYDVAIEGDAMAVAMELVEGGTLRDVAGTARPWRELLAICVRAGRGLAAAHAAKLIHRDFKPENVLCSDDGEVRVSDFGLARALEHEPLADGPVLQTAIAGTPAYMAPEIYRGEPATARSDQFSFCVTTFELLYGQRPFTGDDVTSLRAAILAGEIREPSGSIPNRIRRVLERGLARDPEARFPTMEALLDALVDDRSVRRRRRFALAGALVVALGIGAVVASASGTTGPSCAIDDRALADAWYPVRRVEVTAALRATGLETTRPIVDALDDYARAWLDARREACVATHVRGDQTQRTLDQRFACLDRARRELAELTRLLGRADTRLASRAVDAIHRLRDPRSCANPAGGDVPRDPVVERARDSLDRAAVLQTTGMSADADRLATEAIAALGAGGPPRLVAEALLVRGRASVDAAQFDRSEAQLFEAMTAAQRGGDDQLVAAIWVEIVATTGAQKHRFDLALSNARAAEAALARIDRSSELAIRYEYVLGTMLLAHGKLDEAGRHLERGLALIDDQPRRRGQAGLLRGALCDVERQRERPVIAADHCARALALLEQAFGPTHFKLAVNLNIAGSLAYGQQDYAAAAQHYQRAIAIFEGGAHTDQIGYALAVSNLGIVHYARGDITAARASYERARELFARHHPEHPQRVLPVQGLANLAYSRDDLATAIRYFEEARALIAKTYAANSPALAVVEYNLALAYQRTDAAKAQALLDGIAARSLIPGKEAWEMAARALDASAGLAADRKELATALALRTRALAALDHANAPWPRAWTLYGIGNLHRHMGKPALAIEPLEQAASYFGSAVGAEYEHGLSQFALARARWETGDRGRALAAAGTAKAALAKATYGTNLARLRSELASWVTAREKNR